MATKRVIKKGSSAAAALGVRGLDPDAVPFAKPTSNKYRLSRAAVDRDVSPVKLRDGLLMKKAPVGRKVRFFVTCNHFLNYWETKMDMVCRPKQPYGSINLLRVYRIAQSGQKIVLTFSDELGLKPVNLKAPTAAVAKKWAKNLSNRRRHFEMLHREALRNYTEPAPGVRRGAAFRNPVDARTALQQQQQQQQRRGSSGATNGGHGGTDDRGPSRLTSAASMRMPSFPGTPDSRHGHLMMMASGGGGDDSDIGDDDTSPYVSVAGSRPGAGARGGSRMGALAALPIGGGAAAVRVGDWSDYDGDIGDDDDEWAVPGPPPSPGQHVASRAVRHASVLSARRRSRSQSYQPPPPDEGGALFQPPPMATGATAGRGRGCSGAGSDGSGGASRSASADGDNSSGSSSSESESGPAGSSGDGWKETVDPDTGKTFWYNRKTRCSQWHRPLGRTLQVLSKQKKVERAERAERRQKRERMRQQREVVQNVLHDNDDSDDGARTGSRGVRAEGGSSPPDASPLPSPQRQQQQRQARDTDEWEMHHDPDSGDPFWFNSRTQESTWEDPAAPAAAAVPAEPAAPAVPTKKKKKKTTKKHKNKQQQTRTQEQRQQPGEDEEEKEEEGREVGVVGVEGVRESAVAATSHGVHALPPGGSDSSSGGGSGGGGSAAISLGNVLASQSLSRRGGGGGGRRALEALRASSPRGGSPRGGGRLLGTLATRSRSPAARRRSQQKQQHRQRRASSGGASLREQLEEQLGEVGETDRAETPRAGWREQQDPDSGDVFYFHKFTRKSTWTKPAFWDSAVASGKRR